MIFGKVTSAVVALLLIWSFLHPGVAARADGGEGCIDVALVLTVDASASVSRAEFGLQQNGIAQAFRDPHVLDAISMAGRVAASVIFWGSEGLPKPQSPWMLLDGPEAAEAFARTVESMPREVTGDTALGAGLMAALRKFDSLGTCSVRKVVNLSGDGEETRVYRHMRRSPVPPQVRDLAEAAQVEINALAISNEEEDLARYYAGNVITGPDAFVMEVRSYQEFSTALRRKLIREIGPRAVSGRETPGKTPKDVN